MAVENDINPHDVVHTSLSLHITNKSLIFTQHFIKTFLAH